MFHQFNRHQQPRNDQQQQQQFNPLDGIDCIVCQQLIFDLSERDEEIRLIKEEKQLEIERLRREIQTLQEENARLSNENKKLKERSKKQKEVIRDATVQPPQQFLFGQQTQPQPQTQISPQQKFVYRPPTQPGSESVSVYSSTDPIRPTSLFSNTTTTPEKRNNLNLASKSVLLKQDTYLENSPPRVVPIKKKTEKKQEISREIDPLEYGNRDQFNQVLQNQRNVFRPALVNQTPIEQQLYIPVQQSVTRQPRLPPQSRQPKLPIVQERQNLNHSIHDDEEYARKLQEELFLEDANPPPLNHHHNLFPLQHHHQNHHHANQLILQPFTNQHEEPRQDNFDSYEHNLEAFEDVVVPLKREIWNKLPTSRLIEGEECPICQTDVCRGQWSTTLPCEHFFHSECIGKWFERKHTCPVCRHDLQ
ncbi:RING finger domain-containing protein [Naegleria gruberi]|uniref:RING finger domain-containing protein n=1 Tax=Naegleria gruberi TaxID=5762 RepID=D2VB70_NAEGR|nr:RING finger domain-containing protein [Naegleria gruberi]EFC45856.1 RING finger domain-containing protein [Naegleria gruberi]|eukprot:XP_002678600.1 RING finger domain-containing protein [Naegleria gruberi strain NEG-M]